MRALHQMIIALWERGPRFYVLCTFALASGIAFTTIWLSLSQPVLDARFKVIDQRIHLLANEKARSSDLFSLERSPIVTHFEQVEADPLLLTQDPDQLASFKTYHQFFERQRALFNTLSDGQLSLQFDDGHTESFFTRQKQLADLPFAFWIQVLAGSMGLMITGIVWSYKRYDASAIAFLSCGINFAINSGAIAVYSLRELVIDPELFLLLHRINRLSASLIFYSCIALFWYFPRPLSQIKITYPLTIIGTAVWLNELFQWISWPLHDFLMQFVIAIIVAVAIAIAQWKRSAQRPQERASLRWLLLGILVVMISVIPLYILPMMFAPELSISLEVLNLLGLCAFLGVALGISKYRLFDLEYWWLDAWIWFLGGLALIVVDVIFISLLRLELTSSLALSILFVGWFYLPLRQWILRRFGHHQPSHLLQLLPSAIQFLIHENNQEQTESFWRRLLNDAFSPLQISRTQEARTNIEIKEHGLILAVPSIDQSHTICLEACKKGGRLFHRDDIQLAESIHRLIRFGVQQKQLQSHLENVERDRIMRDLHDDLGANIVSLIHRSSGETVHLARAMLTSLRESIYCLHAAQQQSLSHFLDDLRSECRERCEMHQLHFVWDLDIPSHIEISATRQINLRRIIREALTNIIKHARAKTVRIEARVVRLVLIFEIHDDGCLKQWHSHSNRGVANMQRRSSELGGDISFSVAVPSGLSILFHFPVEENHAIRFNS